MNMKFYVQLNRKIIADKTKRQLVLLLNELVTYIIALIYLISLIVLIVKDRYREVFLLVGAPLAGFVLSRFLRMILKVPRPYYRAKIRPLERNKSTSYSFPSCHIASAFVIGVTFCSLSHVVIGVFVLILACALAVLRVLSGAHYIRDVVAGALLGIVCGLIPFFIR